MKHCTSLAILAVFCVVLIDDVDSWSGQVCSRTVCGWRWERRCVYSTWQGCCGWRNVRVSYYYNEYFCCNGWTTSSNRNCNRAICRPPCLNSGTCSQPGVCACTDGWTGYRCGGAATCSYNSPCFPGDCQGTSGNGTCVCSPGFGGSTCLEIQDKILAPTINRCNATFTFHMYDPDPAKDMDMYYYFGDATNINATYVLWSNQIDFNVLDMVMEVNLDTEYDKNQPLPDYVHSMELGIVEAKVVTQHYKLGFGGIEGPPENVTYKCDGPTRDNPINNEVLVCMLNGTNNKRIDSADRFVLNFMATSGGYRRLKRRDNNNVYPPQYYTGKTTTSIIEFRFDYVEPDHCIEDSTPCTDKEPLFLAEDITGNTIRPTWDGWRDALSGLSRYSFEVWKMEYSKDFQELREQLITESENPKPVFIREVNITNPVQFPSFTPTEPGVYSCILEVSDLANNTRYIRRFVLYDRTSEITFKSDKPLFCSSASASAGYNWQTIIGDTDVRIEWTDHFINQIHADGHFLSPISSYQPRLYDGGRRKDYKKIDPVFEDNEGKMNRNGTNNVNGIVSFEIAYQRPTTDISGLSWNSVDSLNQHHTSKMQDIRDGDARQFWVRATDIMGNTRVNFTIVRFDSSGPSMSDPEMDYNINGRYDFSSRLSFLSKDLHSGVPVVKIKIVTSLGVVKYQHTYNETDLLMSPSQCQTSTNCYCAQAEQEKCYKDKITLDINNCWMGVAMDENVTEPHKLEISAYNGAMLAKNLTTEIANVKALVGIQDYYGVANLRTLDVTKTGFTLTWKQPKSCYPIFGIKLMVTDTYDYVSVYEIHKWATKHTVAGLNASESFKIQMFTKYGDDDYFEMSKGVELATILPPAAKIDPLSGGSIAGIVVGVLLLVILVLIILIFLHRKGRLNKAEERVAKGINAVRSTIKRDHATKSGNRAKSGVHDDDIYFYGGMQMQSECSLARKSISLDSEISRGKFAIIYKAFYYGMGRDAETVAAKTLKDQVNEEDVMKMRAKINFYATKVGHHKNVLDFKGSVEDDVRGPFMVLEYCENGNMKDYLRENKSRVNDDMQEKLFRFGYGVCMGMDYLASQGIVHRKLAARNILLDFLFEPKITGFGPDPATDNDNESERIPVKWTAPECMTSMVHANEKSDVWSFGVVVWEIFSMGETPYADVKSQNLPNWLRQNNRMSKPEYSDDSFYKLMKKCWQYESNKRPNFRKLKSELSKLFTEGPDEDYYYRPAALYDNNKLKA